MNLRCIVKLVVPSKMKPFVVNIYEHYKAMYFERFFHMSDAEFLGYIEKTLRKRKWHSGLKDIGRFLKRTERSGSSFDEKKVLFLTEYVTGRCYKLAMALYDQGWKIYWFHGYNSHFVNVQRNDFLNYIGREVEYNNFAELICNLAISDACVIHYFTTWGSCYEANVILKHKGLFSPIIVERYDVISGMYKPEIFGKTTFRNNIFKCEKYVLEHADGICQREYSFEYLQKKLNYNLSQKQLTFFEYPLKSSKTQWIFAENKEVSFCYVGGVVTERERPESCYACHLRFAELCRQHGIHYHMYPTPWDKKRYEDYLQLEKENVYFHIHHPLPYTQLIAEIGQYDYGIFPILGNFRDDNSTMGDYTVNKLIYSGTNKYFDYIAAGLPIIAVTPVRLTQEIEKSGFLFRWTIDEIDFEYLIEHRHELKQIVQKEQCKWTMEYHIHELEDFYMKVCDETR